MSKSNNICPSCLSKAKEVIDEEHDLDGAIKDLQDLLVFMGPIPEESYAPKGGIYRNTKALLTLLKYVKERI